MNRFNDYRRHLERAAASWFADRKLPVQKRAYILEGPRDWKDNLIDPALAVYITDEKNRRERHAESFPLHKYLHHGLSSQAMVFNLAVPLFKAFDVDALAHGFTAVGVTWPGKRATGRLEAKDREIFSEAQGQATSFDLCIEGDGSPVYVEAKLVEKEFGGCSMLAGGDCDGANPARDWDMCPLQRLGRRYWERLDELGFLVGPMLESPVCLLGPYYQFFREAAFVISKDAQYVLLVHGDNPAFQRGDDPERGLWPFLCQFVPADYRGRLHLVTLQAAADSVHATGRHRSWIHQFRKKYALDGLADAQNS